MDVCKKEAYLEVLRPVQAGRVRQVVGRRDPSLVFLDLDDYLFFSERLVNQPNYDGFQCGDNVQFEEWPVRYLQFLGENENAGRGPENACKNQRAV